MRIRAILTALMISAAPAMAPAAGIGARCGGATNLQCDAGLWCEQKPGRCGAAGAEGACVKVGTVCPMVYSPVCGCDGRTYGNECERRGRKVQKAHDGPC